MTMHFLKVSTITKKNPPLSQLRKYVKVDLGGFFFWGLWDLVEDNSEEKPFVAILSWSIHIMPGLKQNQEAQLR